jgi:tryptophan halogenase
MTSTPKIVVLGGGSAGFLSALTFRKGLTDSDVTLICSLKHPVIGVGESTTRAVPLFLHNTLEIDRKSFYEAVQPIWKLGNRLEWGGSEGSHFNYPFDSFLLEKHPNLQKPNLYYCNEGMSDAGRYYSLMDQKRSPFFRQPDGRVTTNENFGYHIDNKRFLGFLENESIRQRVEVIDADVNGVERSATGDVTHLNLEDGRKIEGDLFVDCSGFGSLLLEKTCGAKYVSYTDTLFCDRAVVGSWPRDEELDPYTTTSTMQSGWCWRIGFRDKITVGYVHASQFCSESQATAELLARHPQLTEDQLRVISFPCGRYDNFWMNNVVAIGNASGFVEPLEATALQLITEQLRFVCKAYLDSNGNPPDMMRDIENRRYRWRWDEVRDFLAVHYKFNRQIDSPFWKHCREETQLGAAAEFVEYYQEVGPSMLASHLAPEPSIFGLEGYLTMLIGQQVPTKYVAHTTDRTNWNQYRESVRKEASTALSMDEAMQLMFPKKS